MTMGFLGAEGDTPSASRPVDCASKWVLKCSTRVEASLALLMRRKHFNNVYVSQQGSQSGIPDLQNPFLC